MKYAISILFLTFSMNAMAESAWNYDSCMENVVRQFTCSVNDQNVSIDLEASATQLSYKAASDTQIYGLFVKNVAGGELYISCDDSAELKNVKFEIGGSSQIVTCE